MSAVNYSGRIMIIKQQIIKLQKGNIHELINYTIRPIQYEEQKSDSNLSGESGEKNDE